MPVLVNTTLEHMEAAITEAKARYKILDDFREGVVAQKVYYLQLGQTKTEKLAVIVGAANAVLKVFGQKLEIAGIDLTQLAQAEAELLVIKEQKREAETQTIELVDTKKRAVRERVKNALDDLYSEVHDNVTSKTRRNQRIQQYFVKSQVLTASVKSIEFELKEIALQLQALQAFDGFLKKINLDIFNMKTTIINNASEIVDKISTILQALGSVALVANVGPFNTLPGTLALIQGYLGVISNILSEISSAVNNFSAAAYDFQSISLQIDTIFDMSEFKANIYKFTT